MMAARPSACQLTSVQSCSLRRAENGAYGFCRLGNRFAVRALARCLPIGAYKPQSSALLDTAQKLSRRLLLDPKQGLSEIHIRVAQKAKRNACLSIIGDLVEIRHGIEPHFHCRLGKKNIRAECRLATTNKRYCRKCTLTPEAAVYRGTDAGALYTVEQCAAYKRHWHPDGTELAPRLERGWMLVLARMVERVRRAAA